MSDSIQTTRETAAAIVERINSDAEFKAQLANDPEGVLVAAGLPKDAVAEFVAEELSGEVSGYLAPVSGGCTVTCILTSCTITSL
ncbi:hypothetical protein [Tengunoibacter tsumagoiensis]|uniref:Nif11 domain-containing protein n=1 Tax=Tengunoibacter tsumagoiensis TaxID=2014871 RepID=A0A402A0Y6_9CHLR|nr:hypothetical protein [Tengunoibacter tsumagoiensis]GCE12807.1 hypothetical protein KTT_26660 [Tengunoibacter tsumagoiensis]